MYPILSYCKLFKKLYTIDNLSVKRYLGANFHEKSRSFVPFQSVYRISASRANFFLKSEEIHKLLEVYPGLDKYLLSSRGS